MAELLHRESSKVIQFYIVVQAVDIFADLDNLHLAIMIRIIFRIMNYVLSAELPDYASLEFALVFKT